MAVFFVGGRIFAPDGEYKLSWISFLLWKGGLFGRAVEYYNDLFR